MRYDIGSVSVYWNPTNKEKREMRKRRSIMPFVIIGLFVIALLFFMVGIGVIR